MVRKKAPPKKSRLYQHFAVVTLAVTLTFAMVVDGKESQSAAQGDEKQLISRGSGEIRIAKRAPIFQSMPGAETGFGSEAGVGAGGNGGGAWGYGPSGTSSAATGGEIDDDTLAALGLTRAEWDGLSEAEKRQMLASVGEVAQAQSQVERQQNAEESGARSGGQNYGRGGDAPG